MLVSALPIPFRNSCPILPLTCVEVDYQIGTTVLLEALSFTLSAGGPTVILGPNGAGKTLALKLCHGLINPTRGTLRWSDAAHDMPGRQAMVFQRPVMLRRSVAANIEYGLAVHKVPAPQRAERVKTMLELTGLVALAGRSARVLSSGEQQRLALARAWAMQPEVLFLDEPTANLDPAATSAVEELIIAIAATGTKVVLSTHDLQQARRFAAQILFLHRGRLLESSAADDFFKQPRSAAATAFLRGELWW
ncbi:MAG: ATP-binding cassette domain-containing protein [Gammaproteobacteria bacterium]|nr:ATP-binding cassette domain-containing protein [Gammaproteobacteria bacterium]